MIQNKKIQIFILIFTHYCSIFSQDTTQNEVPFGLPTFSFGINYTQALCFRTLQKNGISTPPVDQIIETRNKEEIAKLGLISGWSVCVNISKKFGIESGFYFANIGYQSRMKKLVQNGPPDPFSPEKEKYRLRFQYFRAPVVARFYFKIGKIYFSPALGASADIFVNASDVVKMKYENGKRKKIVFPSGYTFNTLNIFPFVSTGILIPINEESNLRVEPTFNYGIRKTTSSSIAEFLWSGGINVGYYFDF